jgi:hypothetical protein
MGSAVGAVYQMIHGVPTLLISVVLRVKIPAIAAQAVQRL